MSLARSSKKYYRLIFKESGFLEKYAKSIGLDTSSLKDQRQISDFTLYARTKNNPWITSDVNAFRDLSRITRDGVNILRLDPVDQKLDFRSKYNDRRM